MKLGPERGHYKQNDHRGPADGQIDPDRIRHSGDAAARAHRIILDPNELNIQRIGKLQGQHDDRPEYRRHEDDDVLRRQEDFASNGPVFERVRTRGNDNRGRTASESTTKKLRHSCAASAVNVMVSQRSGPAPPIASPISLRMASIADTGRQSSGGTSTEISMKHARPALAT